MADYDFAEIVVVPFPFVDGPQVKRRPALVLSNRAFNRENGHAVLAMITTGAGSRWPSDIEIDDLAGTGLGHASVVRWNVFTLPNALIVRKAGRLFPGLMAKVGAATKTRFGPH